jgi:hypothetical protein
MELTEKACRLVLADLFALRITHVENDALAE